MDKPEQNTILPSLICYNLNENVMAFKILFPYVFRVLTNNMIRGFLASSRNVTQN